MTPSYMEQEEEKGEEDYGWPGENDEYELP